MTAVTDDFNRADAGTLGTSSSGHTWAEWNNSHVITSNGAAPENDGTCGSFTPELSTGDHFVEFTVATLPQANSFVGLVVRGPTTVGTSAATSGDLILCGVTGAGNNSWVIRTKANLSTTLTTQATGGVTSALVAGDVIRVEASGATVTMYQNGVQRVQWTSATLTTQKRVGIYTDLPTNAVTYPRYDSFSATDLLVTGQLSGALPVLASLGGQSAGIVRTSGAIQGALPALVAPGDSISGSVSTAGELAAPLPVLTSLGGTAAADVSVSGQLAGALPVLVAPGGQLAGGVRVTGQLGGALPVLTTLGGVWRIVSATDKHLRMGTPTSAARYRSGVVTAAPRLRPGVTSVSP